MGKLQEFIAEQKRIIKEKNLTSDVEILRLVYINLGQKLDFDLDYAFGNSDAKKKIYNKIVDDEALDKILESHKTICKGSSYIYARIMSELGIKVEIAKYQTGPHVYNEYIKDGKYYIIDLEEDLEYIQSGAKTQYFLKPEFREQQELVSEEELRKIDTQKIGYIPEGMYLDDMIYMLKKAISSDDLSFYDRVKFVLDNLGVYKNPKHIKYRERMNIQARVFEEVLTKKDLNKLHKIDFVDEESKEGYTPYLLLQMKNNDNKVFELKPGFKYEEISMQEFVERINSGKIKLHRHDRGIPGLKEYLKSSRKMNCMQDKDEK